MQAAQTYGLYAVYLGFTPKFSHDMPFDAGRLRVNCGVTFVKGHVEVWETERGWRVGVLQADGKFAPVRTVDFFRRLPDALQEGAQRADSTTGQRPTLTLTKK